jgi:hypothetical protein
MFLRIFVDCGLTQNSQDKIILNEKFGCYFLLIKISSLDSELDYFVCMKCLIIS